MKNEILMLQSEVEQNKKQIEPDKNTVIFLQICLKSELSIRMETSSNLETFLPNNLICLISS